MHVAHGLITHGSMPHIIGPWAWREYISVTPASRLFVTLAWNNPPPVTSCVTVWEHRFCIFSHDPQICDGPLSLDMWLVYVFSLLSCSMRCPPLSWPGVVDGREGEPSDLDAGQSSAAFPATGGGECDPPPESVCIGF